MIFGNTHLVVENPLVRKWRDHATTGVKSWFMIFGQIFLTCRCCSLFLKRTVKLVEFHYTELTFSQNKDELNQTKVQHFYHHVSLLTSILIANYIPRKKQKRLFSPKKLFFFSELHENHEKYNKEVRLSTGKVSCLPLVSFEKYHRSGPGACSGGKGLEVRRGNSGSLWPFWDGDLSPFKGLSGLQRSGNQVRSRLESPGGCWLFDSVVDVVLELRI